MKYMTKMCKQRTRVHVHDGQTYTVPAADVTSTGRTPYPGLGVILLYLLHLLGCCNSSDSHLETANGNFTTAQSLVAMTSESVYESTDVGPDSITNMITDKPEHEKENSHNTSLKQDDTKTNDVVHKLGLDVTYSGDADEQSVSVNRTLMTNTTTTEAPKAYTRRDIYIRGHLLKHPRPGKRTFHPAEGSDGYFRAPNSVHLTRVHDFRDDPDGDGSTNRKKRKHNTKKERFYNYKMLYDTIKGGNDPNRKKTEFYAWIFGAAMLGLGSVTTITSCFVFCFCSDRAKKKRTARARRPHDKAGEYQRVESVSSIVDHANEPTDSLYEEQVDSVTII